ncbi:MAG: site-2 protease family protein [Candidatus Vogelbacteria bacterium]|nr:site-2 protease family protein [Candidatus Vogelbacteria bacterium]
MQGLELIFGITVLVFSVVVHEVSHGYAADSLGDPTARYAGRLTLNPLAHLDLFGSFLLPLLFFMTTGFVFGYANPVPYNPYNLRHGKWGAALVAAAGPLSNFFLAIIFGTVLRVSGSGTSFAEILSLIVLINIVLGVFNLMPVPPLDGSKVFFALMPFRYNYIEQFMTRYQLFLLFFAIIVFWRPIALVIVPGIFRLIVG